MKKLILIFSLIILSASSVYSQKKEPTKKETFDFIVYMLEYKAVSGDFSPYKKGLKNVQSDYKNLTITYEDVNTIGKGSPSAYEQPEKYTIDLKQIIDTKVREVKNISPKWNPWFKGEWSTDFTLKNKGVTRQWLENNEWKSVKHDGWGIHFKKEEKEYAVKLDKAFRHLIKLTTGFKSDLFDD